MPKKNSIRTAKNNKNPKSLTPFQTLSIFLSSNKVNNPCYFSMETYVF